MKRIFLLLVIAQILAFASAKAQTLDEIVNKFVERNVVCGFNVDENKVLIKNFVDTNYVQFLKVGKTEDFLKLLKHHNPVVRCYSGWALIDKAYPKLDEIYLHLLKNDTVADVFAPCFTLPHLLSNQFYYKYWGELKPEKRETDPTLFTLDSLTLYNYEIYLYKNEKYQSAPTIDMADGYFSSVYLALENRILPESFIKQVEFLASEKKNQCAKNFLKKFQNKKKN